MPVSTSITAIPMLFLLVVTMSAGWQKIYDPTAGGFIPAISKLQQSLGAAAAADVAGIKEQIFNLKVDIIVTAAFMALTLFIVIANVWLWVRILTRRQPAHLREDPVTRVRLSTLKTVVGPAHWPAEDAGF